MRKEFNSRRILSVHQHGRRFIVLEHQYGRRDVMWKRSILVIVKLRLLPRSLAGKQKSVQEKWWFLGVADTNDVIQKIEKTLNNTHTTTQKRTNNSLRNTKKHPEKSMTLKDYEIVD